MRFLILFFLLFSFVTQAFGQDTIIRAEVTFYRGGGSVTFVFSQEGDLRRTYQTGGPTWRKDTLVRCVHRPNPEYSYEKIALHRRSGDRQLLAERTIRKEANQLRVTFDSYDPNYAAYNTSAVYTMDDQHRIIKGRLSRVSSLKVLSPGATTTYVYDNRGSGRYAVTDSLTGKNVAEIFPRKKYTLVRMMEKRNRGHEYTFSLKGILKSVVFRDGALGQQTDLHPGKDGLELSSMSFSLSVLGGPSPKALWHSVILKEEYLEEEIKRRIIGEILETLVLGETTYRNYFPRGYAPAEVVRK